MSDDLKRVQNSIKFLDSLVGEIDWIPANWREKVNLDKLSMTSCYDCVLGQLWTASGKGLGSGDSPYGAAEDSLSRHGHIVTVGKAFGNLTDVWKAELVKPADQTGTTFYLRANAAATRTILLTTEHEGKVYITYTWQDSVGGGVKTVTNSEFDFPKWTTIKPKRFKNGDLLKSSTGRHYYYFSDERVIRVGDGELSWGGLGFYERQDGPLVKASYGSADFYFGGTQFKIYK
jgi:hypothetical protein